MRWFVCVVVSGLAWAVALTVMATTEIGPILATITPNHGLHAGDVVALMGAAAVTVTSFGLAWLLPGLRSEQRDRERSRQ